VHTICTRLSSQPFAEIQKIKLILSLIEPLSNKCTANHASSMYKDLCIKYSRTLPTLAISLSYAYDPSLHPGRIISLLSDPNRYPLLTLAHKIWLHRAQTQKARLCIEQEAHLTTQNSHNKKNIPKIRYLFFRSARQERSPLAFAPISQFGRTIHYVTQV